VLLTVLAAVGDLQDGLVLSAVALVAVLGTVLFARRDVQ
jgi:hypothetical protein